MREQVLAYLHDHNVMTIATHGPHGLWAAAVFYVSDDFDLYFLSSPASRHGQNIEAQAEVSATIQEDYKDWRGIKGIQLEGRVARLKGAEQAAALQRYGKKFPLVGNLAQAPAEIITALGRIAWYRLTPSRLFFIDNSRGLGHRDEVPLSGGEFETRPTEVPLSGGEFETRPTEVPLSGGEFETRPTSHAMRG